MALDPAEEHYMEVFEALMQSAIDGDVESFRAFNVEWERCQEMNPSMPRMTFEGTPTPYRVEGHCGHCGQDYLIEGIAFGDFVPGLAQALHVGGDCPNGEDCLCWSEETNRDPSTAFCDPFCQRCGYPERACGCVGGVRLGPCALNEREERLSGQVWRMPEA